MVEDDHHVEVSIPWRRSWKLWALVLSVSLGFVAFSVQVAVELGSVAGAAVLGGVALVPLVLVAVNTTVVAASAEGILVETRPFGLWPFNARVWPRGAFGFVAVQPWSWNRRDGTSRLLRGPATPAQSPWRHMYAVMLEYGDGTNETLVWFVDSVHTSDWIRRRLMDRLGG